MNVEAAALHLLEYCRKNDWTGADPYDALNSRLLADTFLAKSRAARIAMTQFLKRLPWDPRPFLQMSNEQNPKAMGLFLMAILRLHRAELLDDEPLIAKIIDRLVALRSPDSPYWCWGYSFPWQTRTVLVPRWTPNLVCTAFVANALLEMYEERHRTDCLTMAVSAGEYIVSTLYWEGSGGIAGFSYPLPEVKTQVHNANFLAAALLCRLYRHSGEKRFLDAALKAARYSAGRQQGDGSWVYGEAGTQTWVDNFHTGYNLCALRAVGMYAETDEFEPSLVRGAMFYRDHFFTEAGVAKYFHDRVYPIDVHSVAQGIITLVLLQDIIGNGTEMAHKVCRWSLTHMLDARGFFYYRRLRFMTNKLSYMRWSQAWMLLALATLSAQHTQDDVRVAGTGLGQRALLKMK